METKDSKITVGIADMKMAKERGMLITYALGSCIGICLYDQKIKLAALVHIMLPLNMETGRKNPLKYADTGIRETLRMMEAKGASRSRITAKIAGGAKMFDVNGGSMGNIGQRNIESVHMNLKKEGIQLLREDVGGSVARTLLFDPATGLGCVRSYGRKELIIYTRDLKGVLERCCWKRISGESCWNPAPMRLRSWSLPSIKACMESTWLR